VGVVVSSAGRRRSSSRIRSTFLVLGTPVASIDAAEDRDSGRRSASSLGFASHRATWPLTLKQAKAIVKKIGYPVSCGKLRAGGRAMEIVYDDRALERVTERPYEFAGSLAREGGVSQSRPILLDSFPRRRHRG